MTVGSRRYGIWGRQLLSAFSLLLSAHCILLIISINCHASEDIYVKKILVQDLISCSEKELLLLMGIHVGLNDKEVISKGIKRAFKKQLFEDIIIDHRSDGTLVVTVKEHEYIDKIEVEGNSYFSDKEVKNEFSLKENKIMRYALIEEGIRELRDYLRMRGFPDVKVNIDVKRVSKPNKVLLIINVSEGQPQIIRVIDIQGFHEWIKENMDTEIGDIYDTEKIRKDLRKVSKYLKTDGYHNPVVGPFTYSEGVLTVFVNPGKRLNISFVGNDHMKSSKILKALPFDEAEEITEELTEEASAKIVSLYQKDGYPFAQVAPVKRVDDNSILITFFIYEGAKYTIKKISIQNTTMPEGTLKNVMNLKEGGTYNPDLIEKDKGNIVELYRAFGFRDAIISATSVNIMEEKSMVEIDITIDEGKKVFIQEIAVNGNTVLSQDEINHLLKIKIHDPYNELDIIDSRRRILNAYRERGLMDATVDIESKFLGEWVSLIFNIYEGEIHYFGKTIVKGNMMTKTNVIMRELNYKEGLPINYRLIPELSRRLYQIGLFQDVDIKILERYDNKRDVLIEVNERKPGVFEFGFGYDEYEKLRGFIYISYGDLWGMNREINLRSELSALRKRFLLGYNEPYLLGRPIIFRSLIQSDYREEKNIDTGEIRYKVQKYSAEVSVEKDIGLHTKGELSYNYSIVNTFDVNPDVILSKEDVGTLAISSIRPGVLYDTRDNPFDPYKGVLLGASLKIASTYLLGETNFVKLNIHGNIYRQLTKRIIFAFSLRGGIAQGFGDTRELPIVERFFLGGRNTVRGFQQDNLGPKEDGTPTGGNVFFMSNIELRTHIGKGVGVVVFLDTGNVWRKIDDIDARLRYTTGLGIRYKTPVGPIRIDYGHKLDRRDGESTGEIHFSIGHAF